MLNNDSYTYFHNNGQGNILDIAIASPTLAQMANFNIGEDLGSDHLPIDVEIDWSLYIAPPRLCRNTKKADWDKFQNLVVETLPEIPDDLSTPEEVDEYTNSLTTALGEAYDEVCPPKPAVNRNWWAFTPRIKELIKLRRQIRRRQKASRNPEWNRLYNRVNKLTRKAINEQKSACWENYISSIDEETDS